jgi:mono/diheme cytochrome c family protein
MSRLYRLIPCTLPAVALLGGIVLAARTAAAATGAGPFAEVGVKFVESHCVSCHGKEKQKANLALHTVRDDLGLLRARKQWRDVVRMVESGDMPPEDKPQPTDAERRAFVASVKAVFAAADNARPDPGRMTVRRLNRTEYNNTIRDLLHVEFKPAEDFPSDDVGFGFDNIADVMSVSPVLMERYLDAAERIAEDAIPLAVAGAPKRTMAGKFCEPASATVPQDRFRPINAAQKEAILSGPLNTPVRMTAGDEFWVRARLYAEGAGDAPVKVALLVSGPKIENPSPVAEVSQLDGIAVGAVKPCVILKTVVITARDAEHAQLVEMKIKGAPGTERMALAAFKPPPGKATPTLRVEFLETEGPLDTRTASKKALGFAPNKPEREQTFEVLTRFVASAWRRPGTTEEIARLCKMVDYAVGHNEGWGGGLRRAITAVLASPKFVFRLEPDAEPENPEPHRIDEFQLATRLAYFLWSSGPDDRLLELAYEKKLSANLEGEVRRMLKDPRSAALVDNFALQWLQLGRIATHSADAKVFAKWDPKLAGEMIEETRRFCAEILRDDHSVLDLLDANFTWVDRRLADLYGLKVPGGFGEGEWKRVSLAGTPRGGLLTQASVLTVTSNPTRTSPVKRGKWVLEQFLGDPPPPAPPNVPSLDDSHRKELTGATFRQKLEQHRTDPKCANCHAKMDAFGLTLENFDGIGQWRDRDESGGRVDASARLGSGVKLNGVADLRALLRKRKEAFTRCLSEKLLIYALGRGLDYYDEPTLDRIEAALARDNYKFSTLILEIVKSDPFRLRRGKGQETLSATATQ